MSRTLRLFVAFAVTVAGAACGVVFAIPAMLVAAALSGGAFAAVVVASELGYAAVGYAFRQTEDAADVAPSWAFPGARGVGLVALGTTAAVAVNRVGFFLGSLVGVDPVATVSPPTDVDPVVAVLVMTPVFLLVVGPAEEYLFRGVLQRYLAGGAFSTRGAIGWVTALFLLVHLPNVLQVAPIALVITGPVLVCVSLLLGWCYERTGTLVVPALVHGLYDVAVFWILLARWG